MSEKIHTVGLGIAKPYAPLLLRWFIGWCCLVGLGCVPPKVQVQSAPQFDPSRIFSLAVLPFQAIQTPQWKNGSARGGVRDPEEIRMQFRLPGADQMDMADSRKDLYVVSEAAAQRITTTVVSALDSRPSLRVIGPPESSVILSMEGQGSPLSLQTLAQEAGNRFQVDGVVTGLVRTYRERDGSKLGAKPAAVGFEVYLLRPSDGVVLWTGEFFEEQKPLTQDLVGFFEAGGFVTADELAELGVKKVMNEFPVGRVNNGPPLPPTSLSGSP